MDKLFPLFGVVALLSLSGCISSGNDGAQVQAGGNAVASGMQSAADVFVANKSSLQDNSITEFIYRGEPAILVNFGGEYSAYVNACPHMKARFDKSSLVNDRIQCPRHGATFKPTSGEYLGHANGNNLGLNGLTTIPLRISGDGIYAV
jgi:nitrite reductase/ring-hydroxylating ferredoxin subunit